MKRVALYARVSTREQKDHGTSLQSQLEAMRAWAQENGCESVYEFAEDFTGTELYRPHLDEVKRLTELGEIDALVIYSWDRLGRDMDHQVILRHLFEEESGIEVICITQPEMDELATMIYRTAMGMAAHIENHLRRERSVRGVREAAITRGQIPGGGAGLYGYDYHAKSKGGDGRRTINEEEARVVRLVFRWLVDEKVSVYSIAQRLEQIGIRTKKGLKKWRRATIYRMLTHPGYCGKVYAFRWRNVEPENPRNPNRRRRRSSTRLRKREDWQELEENPTPAIVSEELWEAAQRELQAKRRRTRRKPRYPYLLRGMIRCYCGKSMVANTVSGRWRYYRCCATSGVRLAHHFSIPADALEGTIWGGVQEILTMNPRMILKQLKREKEGGRAILKERIQEVEKAIADLQLAESRAISLFSFGKMDQRKVQEQVERIRTERAAWENELTEFQARLQAKTDLEAAEEGITEIMRMVSP